MVVSVTTSGHSRLSKGLDVDRDASNVMHYFWSPCDPLNVTGFYKQSQVAPNVGVRGPFEAVFDCWSFKRPLDTCPL